MARLQPTQASHLKAHLSQTFKTQTARRFKMLAAAALLSSSVLAALSPSSAYAEQDASSDLAISVLQKDSSSALQIQITGLGPETRARFSLCEQTTFANAPAIRCEAIGRASGYSVSELEAKERRAQSRAYRSIAINIGAGLIGTVVSGASMHSFLQRANPSLLNGNAAQQLVGAVAMIFGAGAGGGLAGGITYLILRPDADLAARGLFRAARDGSVGVVVDDLSSVVDSVTSILMSED